MSLTNIVICGGHLSPALAVIEKLKLKKDYKLYFIGRRYALEGDKAQSLEYRTIIKSQIPFLSIITGRWQRFSTFYSLLSLFKIPIGLLQSIYLLRRIQPKLVISFGGYVALPISLAAWLLKIPVMTHEQTSILGLSNRIISKIAQVLCLSWRETKLVPKSVKTVLTGNPVRVGSQSVKRSAVTAFGGHNLPLLYITGGSLGARSINQVVSKIIPQLSKRFRILHQCGAADDERDLKQLLDLKNALPTRGKKNYKVVKYIDPIDVGSILKEAFLVVGRAGANTVAEIAVIGVPAIFIPLPWAADNEQEYNAKVLENRGLAKIILQKDLTYKKLIGEIDYMYQHISEFQKNGKRTKRLFHRNAAQKIVEIADSILSPYSYL